MMLRLPITCLLFALIAFCVDAQERTPWTELTRKDAEKILNDSPWGKTQTETDTTEMFFSPTRPGTPSIGQPAATRSQPNAQQQINNNRADQGATNQPIAVNYRIRFLSAKPIREAISRIVVLDRAAPEADLVDAMQTFIDRDYSRFIVVTVVFDSTDGRFSAPAVRAFGAATLDTLKNETYLERKDGRRIYLMDYRAPGTDGLGAKFVFERAPEGKLFLNGDSGSFRFYSEVSDKIKLNVTYKIADLIYNRNLEY
jgi:hypothetical protein